MSSFIIEEEKEISESNKEIGTILKQYEKITPKEQLKFARYITTGLGIFYILAMTYYTFMPNDKGRFLFTTTQQTVMNFGAFVIGFYFSNKSE